MQHGNLMPQQFKIVGEVRKTILVNSEVWHQTCGYLLLWLMVCIVLFCGFVYAFVWWLSWLYNVWKPDHYVERDSNMWWDSWPPTGSGRILCYVNLWVSHQLLSGCRTRQSSTANTPRVGDTLLISLCFSTDDELQDCSVSLFVKCLALLFATQVLEDALLRRYVLVFSLGISLSLCSGTQFVPPDWICLHGTHDSTFLFLSLGICRTSETECSYPAGMMIELLSNVFAFRQLCFLHIQNSLTMVLSSTTKDFSNNSSRHNHLSWI